MKLNYLVVHQIPSSYFTFSRCNWNWRKMEVKKRRLSSNSQGCCCMELSIQAGSQSLPSCRCKWKLRTPSTCPEHWDWALTMSNLLTMADRKTLSSCFLLFCPPLWMTPLVLLVLSKPKAMGRSCLHFTVGRTTPSLLHSGKAFIPELIPKFLMVLSIVKTYMKVMPLL